jgi:predicted GIY-YIG superfamily endonuclease
MYYLYKITNLMDSKIYLGMTKVPSSRWSYHKTSNSKSSHLSKIIKQLGPENFTFEVLCKGEKSYIKDLEEKAIVVFNSLEPNGYNREIGKKGAPATNARRSKSHTGVKLSEERVPKTPCLVCGKKCAAHIINRFHNENCKHG